MGAVARACANVCCCVKPNGATADTATGVSVETAGAEAAAGGIMPAARITASAAAASEIAALTPPFPPIGTRGEVRGPTAALLGRGEREETGVGKAGEALTGAFTAGVATVVAVVVEEGDGVISSPKGFRLAVVSGLPPGRPPGLPPPPPGLRPESRFAA